MIKLRKNQEKKGILTMKSKGRPVQYNNDFYKKIYLEYANNTLSMKEMANIYHTSQRTFARWISEARKRGLTNGEIEE